MDSYFNIILEKKLSLNLLLASIIGMVGVAIIFANQMDQDKVSLGGLILALGSAFFWAISSYNFADQIKPKNFLISILIEFFTAMIVLLVVAFLRGEFASFSVGMVPFKAWVSLFVVYMFSSFAAYIAFQYLLSRHPPELANSSTFVNPLVATLLAITFLGERLSSLTIIAGALVIIISSYLIIKPPLKS